MRLIFTCFVLSALGMAAPVRAQEEIPEPKPAKSCSVEKVKLSTSDLLKQINSEIAAGQAKEAQPATSGQVVAASGTAAPAITVVPVAEKPVAIARKPPQKAASPRKPVAPAATAAKANRKKKPQQLNGFY